MLLIVSPDSHCLEPIRSRQRSFEVNIHKITKRTFKDFSLVSARISSKSKQCRSLTKSSNRVSNEYGIMTPVGVVVRNIAISAGSLGFDFRAGQIGHNVANGTPPLRCFFGAVLPRAKLRRWSRHSLHTSA